MHDRLAVRVKSPSGRSSIVVDAVIGTHGLANWASVRRKEA